MNEDPGLYVLASDALRVTAVPSLGGRLTEITDLSANRQWLWRNPRVPFGAVAPDSEYDEVWQGGFEELFPNDGPVVVNDRSYPDHGELWSIPWEVVETSEKSITMSTVGRITGVRVAKSLQVEGAQLRVGYSLEHPGDEAMPYLFKLHPALAIDENCRIDLPGGSVEKVARGFGNILTSAQPQDWPTDVNLDQCRSPATALNEFVYVSELPEGWCGVTDTALGSSLRIEFPLGFFPYCWLFMTYGGWREHSVVVLEPCTNYPKDLHEALERGTSAILPARSRVSCDVQITVSSAYST